MNGVDISVKIKNYKCFRDEFAGFDKIMPVNIIIGRNNSGKSSLLDLLQFQIDPNNADTGATFQFQELMTETELRKIFSEKLINRGGLGGNQWNCHGSLLFDLKIQHEKGFGAKPEKVIVNPEVLQNTSQNHRPSGQEERQRRFLIERYYQEQNKEKTFFFNKTVRKLSAERDVKKEEMVNSLNLNTDGSGATNIIGRYIHYSGLDRRIIQVLLLRALNQIFNPDNKFDEITTRLDQDQNFWEVYLHEQEKGLIPLSKSGSGLKTVILVLLNLLVIPKSKDTDKKNTYLYAFEELENNLHPALLRRLFKYIEEFALKNKCYFFITTHSNVVIDIFSNSSNAQIIHVTHDGRQAFSRTIDSFDGHNMILDDIGAKASDLLQANGIVWLEGPSDRIYFNKWVELYSDGKLREHRDYECAFYGGSLLAHFDAVDPSESCDAINILKVNRNAILIGDSDKTKKTSRLKPRLRNIRDAMEGIGAYVWVTRAKEIENYLPATAIEKTFNKQGLPEIDQYEHFYKTSKLKKDSGYWQKNKLAGTFNKVSLSEKMVLHFTKEMLSSRFDLEKEMKAICKNIEDWNQK
ncbi:MAG: ATP-binding protein [Phycisphaerae bacterium]|nr:ATP-binding protein [Phycisphaerae bacterium]